MTQRAVTQRAACKQLTERTVTSTSSCCIVLRCDSIVLSDVTTSCMMRMMSQHAVTACHYDACCDSEMSVLSVSEVNGSVL